MEKYEQEIDANDIISQNQMLTNRNNELAGALSHGSFNEQDEQNLIQYQLETDKILERIEHFLKGDQVKFNENGAYYAPPTKEVLTIEKYDEKNGTSYFIQEFKEKDKGTELIKNVLVKIINSDGEEIDILNSDSKLILERIKNNPKNKIIEKGYKYITIFDEEKKPLNEYGVSELMRIMSMYITKETFLSYYDEDRINEIMGDLGDALSNFLYCNYEKMGMDTKFKESKYIMICLNLLHSVESCYRRALGGSEQENIRTRAIVTQNQGFGGNSINRGISKKKWNPLKLSTW